MTLVLGIDPGTESPGFAVWDVGTGTLPSAAAPMKLVYAAPKDPPFQVDAIVCESGWPHGPMGKLGMWGLGWRAAWQMRDALEGSPSATCYTIAPKAWRAALGGLPANAPKPVIVARLRLLRYRGYVNAERWTDDVLEACGIAEAAALILGRPLRDREALKEVKR